MKNGALWLLERSFAWMTRFRRLARDYERWPETLAGLHLLAKARAHASSFCPCHGVLIEKFTSDSRRDVLCLLK
jgi:hypothetical protein